MKIRTSIQLMSQLIEFSTNPNWVGKPYKGKDGRQYYKDRKVNLGYGWINYQLPFRDIFTALTDDGVSLAPALIEGADGNRRESNFASHQLALVDIDDGVNIDDMDTHPFYQKYAAGLYTTPSHTESHHKFRVVFRLENKITSASDMRCLYTALIRLFGGDTACKDGSRLFFGTMTAEQTEYRPDGVLPDKIIKAMIKEIKREQAEEMAKVTHIEYLPPSDEDRENILNALSSIYIGEYPMWFKIGCGLKHGGFNLEDFKRVTIGGLMRQKSGLDCEHLWKDIDANKSRQATLGTVVWYIRSRSDEYDRTKKIIKMKMERRSIENELAAIKRRHKDDK